MKLNKFNEYIFRFNQKYSFDKFLRMTWCAAAFDRDAWLPQRPRCPGKTQSRSSMSSMCLPRNRPGRIIAMAEAKSL
ncbi:MAG: hypothetical protein LBV45_09565 [Xanthomonadaceae bacterium]|jgi:hypothetical protein|nr:hypothetical protein [Xanthomonadaceae bacterium]